MTKKEIIFIVVFLSGTLLIAINLKGGEEFSDKNCADFSSRSEMLKEFRKYKFDVHRLDLDNDGIPCENFNY